jgi:hypothetical protein
MIHFGKRRIPVVLLILAFPVKCLPAQKTHGDNNNGTYTNPVTFAGCDSGCISGRQDNIADTQYDFMKKNAYKIHIQRIFRRTYMACLEK